MTSTPAPAPEQISTHGEGQHASHNLTGFINEPRTFGLQFKAQF